MEYKLKKDYLTREESKAIIANSMKNFFDKEDNLIEGLNFNYLDMDERFFDSLGLFCIEDYNDDIKDYIYNEGKQEELLDSIKNANETYDMLYCVADKTSSLENILYDVFKSLPRQEDIGNLNELMPNLKETFDKYDEIIRNNKGETTEK